MTAAPGGPAASAWPRAHRAARGLAAAVGLASFTALVFGAALLVTMPAQVLVTVVNLPSQVETLTGRAWAGEAGLRGGHRLSWRLSPRDLWRLRVVADAELLGPDTRLSGMLAVSPWAVSSLGWSGRAGPGLLQLAPGFAATCTPLAVVDVERLSRGARRASADGTVAVAAGSCALPSGTEAPVPAMTLSLSTEGRDARAVLVRDDDGATLAGATVTGSRRLRLRIEPAGAALVPGLPASGPIELERPL